MKSREITVAIHPDAGTDFYSDKWIEYCQKHNIKYKLVDCYSDNIMEELQDCDALLWHWIHIDYKAQLFARQLMLSLEAINYPVYPNAKSCWHFDDKLGQKYLLEAIKHQQLKTMHFLIKNLL